MKESKKMAMFNSLLTILGAIVDSDDTRTTNAGTENEFWNIGFRCATGRIFYAVQLSAEKSQQREDDLRAELADLCVTDPDAQNAKTGYVLENLEKAMAVSKAMHSVNADFEKLHSELVGDDFDREQYEATFPQNRKDKPNTTANLNRIKAALEHAAAREDE
jgi:hypothetical protein